MCLLRNKRHRCLKWRHFLAGRPFLYQDLISLSLTRSSPSFPPSSPMALGWPPDEQRAAPLDMPPSLPACLPACLHVAYFNSSNQPHRVTCWFFWKMCCAKMMTTTTGEKRRRRRKGRQAIFHQRATRNRRQHGPIDNTPYAAAAVGKRARHAYWGENAMEIAIPSCQQRIAAQTRNASWKRKKEGIERFISLCGDGQNRSGM